MAAMLAQKLTGHSMFFQLLFIHLFRPFLKYNKATSPLPETVSPRKLCTQAAAMISKLLRLYKRSHGLRQICNICVYIAHSACTIHLLNLPDKNARRDIVHGVKHLEEIAEGWLCARRTLVVLSVLSRKWNVELPEEAASVLARTDSKFGTHYTYEASSPSSAQQSRPSSSQVYLTPSQQASWPHSQQAMPQPMLPQSTAPLQHNYFTTSPAISSSAGTAFALQGPQPRPNPTVYTQTNLPAPPHNATDLQPASYPSHQSTPAPRGAHGSVDSGISGRTVEPTAGASPSDMFGGVEALLRESQDWVFRDQTQLALGFDNWGGVVGDEWMDGVGAGAGAGAASGRSPVARAGYAAINGGNAALSSSANGTAIPPSTNGYVNGNANAAYAGAGMLNGYANLSGYNEDEWYQ